ncbi:MAG TPA: hypothetical protein VEQ63_10255 [Bryobacteraceae bacterium]|nr:hypothetical protein [Bryobacteraceae bacterium]
MIKKISMSAITLALAVASAASSYRVTLFQSSFVNGQELKPGDYKIQLNGDKAVISGNRQKIEANVKTETTDEKFAANSVRYRNGDGKYRIQEIRLGGTKTKLLFEN